MNVSVALHAPQIVYLLLVALGWGITFAKWGQSKGIYDWPDILGTLLISLPLLYWGGFFSQP